jgi:outer membrane receptor protein involved in Fe transport
MRRALVPLGLTLALLPEGLRAEAAAADADEPAPTPTYTVDVRERRPVTAASAFVRDSKAFEFRSVSDDPGEILEVTPGLEVGQHAGGGKANQYLIRGFDADHGTDIALFVDNVPVNVRSHAHGQGYSDFHFVIPETVERLEITKGPYEASIGDFATAGSVNLVTREWIDESYVKFEGGSFDTQRYLLMFSPDQGPFAGGEEAPARALFAFEAYGTDGPFHNEEDLWRYNVFGRVGVDLGERTRLEGTLNYYDGDWNASNEVPRRAVDGPGFDRWDAVDPTDGGQSSTARTLLKLVHEPSALEQMEAAAWFTWYTLDLYSNFTFFLDDPVGGDQILQPDDRIRYGGWLEYARQIDTAPVPVAFRAGLQTQSDDAHVRLHDTTERSITSTTRDDDVRESSLALWGEVEVIPVPWVRSVIGLRAEQFWFDTGDRSGLDNPDGHERDALLLPKVNLILRPFAEDGLLPSQVVSVSELELFLNFGQGYHSNDARDVATNPDDDTLPTALGWEVGLRTRFFERLDVAVAYWWLNLQSEFVYVGDAGDTEERGRTRRQGVELAAELEILDWLFWEGSLGYSSGEFAEPPDGAGPGNTKIPQAVRFIADTGLVARHPSGVSAELNYHTLGERYGTENPSDQRLQSWGVWNAALRYRRGPVEVGLLLENLGNTHWESAEYYFTSRLQGEPPEGVDDLHFVPGNPRNARVVLAYYF